LLKSLPGVAVEIRSEVADGAGNVTLEGVVVALKLPGGDADSGNRLTIDRIEAQGFDADAVARVFDAARYGDTPDETFRPLARQLTLTGTRLTVRGAQMLSLATWTLENWEMKPFGFRPGGPNFFAQFRPVELGIAQIWGHVVDSLRLDAVDAREIHFALNPRAPTAGTPPAGGVADAEALTYDIAVLHLSGVDRGRFGRVTFAGMVSTQTETPIGTMTTRAREGFGEGADISAALPALLLGEWPPVTRTPLIDIGESCALDYTIEIPRVGVFAFPRACTAAIPFVWLVPARLAFDWAGTFSPAPAGTLLAPNYVARFFTRPLDISVQFEAAYEPDSGVATLAHYRFRMAEFGTIDLKASMGGLQLDTLRQLYFTFQDRLSLVSGEIELIDEGGVQKILEIAAGVMQDRGASAEMLKAETLKYQAMTGINMMVGVMGNTPTAAAFGQALRDFLDKGGRVVAGVRPRRPMIGADFQSLPGKPPGEITDLVGLYAEWTPP
jgi:hypothetical protein